ncbi:MAG: hypothetical protein ABI439_02945 [Rhodospirillales bacterium]
MFTRFGLWYLATLAPAVALLQAMLLLAPLDRPLASFLSAAVTIGIMPIVPIVMLAAAVALRVDTDALLPNWYRRLFGAAT